MKLLHLLELVVIDHAPCCYGFGIIFANIIQQVDQGSGLLLNADCIALLSLNPVCR